MPLASFLPANAFAVMLVFARIGSALMLLPGFGELFVPQRYRLLLALLLSLMLAAVLARVLPALPVGVRGLVGVVVGEVVLGVFAGTLAGMLLVALDAAGSVVWLQVGPSGARIFATTVAV